MKRREFLKAGLVTLALVTGLAWIPRIAERNDIPGLLIHTGGAKMPSGMYFGSTDSYARNLMSAGRQMGKNKLVEGQLRFWQGITIKEI